MKRIIHHFILCLRARLAYDAYVRADSRFNYALMLYRESRERLQIAMRRIKEARRIHESLRGRLVSKEEVTK